METQIFIVQKQEPSIAGSTSNTFETSYFNTEDAEAHVKRLNDNAEAGTKYYMRISTLQFTKEDLSRLFELREIL